MDAAHGHNSPGYKAYFRTPQWKEMVKRIKKRDKRCQGCGWIAFLDVHHKTYKHFRREFDEELVLVCRGCHDAIHRKHKKYNDPTKHSLWKVTDQVLLEKKNRPPVLAKQEKNTGTRGGSLVLNPVAQKVVKPVKKKAEAGDLCRHCQLPLYWSSNRLTGKRLKKAFHYCKYLRCKKRHFYFFDEFKTLPGQQCDCRR